MLEAAWEMLCHAFWDIGMNRVWCGYYDGNTKSEACAGKKVGFLYQWTTEGVEVSPHARKNARAM